MTLLSDVLKELRNLINKTPIKHEIDRPFSLADYIRNMIVWYSHKAVHIVLRRYKCRSRELAILMQTIKRALMSLVNYPQLFYFWDYKIQSEYERICK